YKSDRALVLEGDFIIRAGFRIGVWRMDGGRRKSRSGGDRKVVANEIVGRRIEIVDVMGSGRRKAFDRHFSKSSRRVRRRIPGRGVIDRRNEVLYNIPVFQCAGRKRDSFAVMIGPC